MKKKKGTTARLIVRSSVAMGKIRRMSRGERSSGRYFG
jgi:hypothetical protein